jgi:hypothetical protein
VGNGLSAGNSGRCLVSAQQAYLSAADELEASSDLEMVRLMAELDDMSDEAAQRLLAQRLCSQGAWL